MRVADILCIFVTLIIPTSYVMAGDLDKIKEPTKTEGVMFQILQQETLATQIPSMRGYDFRARRIVFEPGASFKRHSHATRPGFVYILKGEIIENRNGKTRKFKAGDSWYEDASTDHWLRNISDKHAEFIKVDLPLQK